MPPRVGRGGAGDAGVVDDVGIAQMRALIEANLRDGDAERETLRAFHDAWSSEHDGFRDVVAAQERALRALHAEQLARLRDLLRRARDAPAPVTPDLLARRWAQRVALARGELAVAAYLNDAANAREAVETRAHLHRVDRDNAARLADDHRRRVDETVALSSAMANVESKLLRWRANVAEGLRVAARPAAPRARTRVRTRTDAGRDPKTTTSKAPSKTGNARNGNRLGEDVGDFTRGKLASATNATIARVLDAKREATTACETIVARSKDAAARSTRATRVFLAEAREKAFASRGGSVDWSADPRGARDEPPLEPPLDILEANGVNRVARALEAARAMVEGGEGFRGDDSERAEAAAEAERQRQSRKRRETRGGLLVMEEDDESDEDGGDERRGVAPGDGTRVGNEHQSRDGVERRRVSSSGTSGASSSAASRGRRRDDRRSVVDWIEDEDEERGDLLESLRAELGTGTGTESGTGTRPAAPSNASRRRARRGLVGFAQTNDAKGFSAMEVRDARAAPGTSVPGDGVTAMSRSPSRDVGVVRTGRVRGPGLTLPPPPPGVPEVNLAESRSRQIHLERRRVDSFTIRGARRDTAVDNKRKSARR